MANHKAQIMTFSPIGGSNWVVMVDGKVLGTYDTSDGAQMSESGVRAIGLVVRSYDMEDVELALRRHFGIADDVECPEYPY